MAVTLNKRDYALWHPGVDSETEDALTSLLERIDR